MVWKLYFNKIAKINSGSEKKKKKKKEQMNLWVGTIQE